MATKKTQPTPAAKAVKKADAGKATKPVAKPKPKTSDAEAVAAGAVATLAAVQIQLLTLTDQIKQTLIECGAEKPKAKRAKK